MEVVGKSKATVILESCLDESSEYFSDHVRILKCNPYCTNVVFLEDLGIYQWIFQVKDPRNNPITAIFFVEQMEERIAHSEKALHVEMAAACADLTTGNVNGKCIRWVSSSNIPDLPIDNNHTFIGHANARICLYHRHDRKTEVHFETDIALDFQLSFPLNLMPEGVLKFMSEAIMSQIMQQATESMLCQVQSDICCFVPDLTVEGGRK